MAGSFDIGAPHPFCWPKTNGFHTHGSLEEMAQHLKENKTWNVTEKLDGSNVCLSTQGWMSSRNKIISKRDSPITVFQGVHLNKVEALFTKLDTLKELLRKNVFHGKEVEVLLYGELILKGTGMAKYDLYHYKKRQMLPGDIYCFGIGLILPEDTKLPLIFNNGFSHQGTHEHVYIIPMSYYLSQLLHQTHIEHTPLLFTGKLSHVFELDLEDKVFQRIVEGFILSGTQGEGLIKWKYFDHPNSHLKHHFEEMMDLCKDSIASKGVSSLQQLCGIAHKFMTKLEDIDYQRLLYIYFQRKGVELVHFLHRARLEGTLSFNLALEKETEKLFQCIKRSFDDYHWDPKLCFLLKEKIYLAIKTYYQRRV